MFNVNAEKKHARRPKLTKNTKWLIAIVTLTFCVVGSLTAIVISSIGRLNDEEIAEGGTYGDGNSCSSDGENSCENGGECEQGNNSNEQGDLDDDNNGDDGANWSEEDVYGFDEYIRDIIASAESETDVINDLGQLIDVSEGIEKADLLQKRLAYILEMDVDKKYEDLAINDAKSIDEILESIDSARQVMNVAVYYGNQSVIAEYATILQARKEASRDENDNDDEEIIG